MSVQTFFYFLPEIALFIFSISITILAVRMRNWTTKTEKLGLVLESSVLESPVLESSGMKLRKMRPRNLVGISGKEETFVRYCSIKKILSYAIFIFLFLLFCMVLQFPASFSYQHMAGLRCDSFSTYPKQLILFLSIVFVLMWIINQKRFEHLQIEFLFMFIYMLFFTFVLLSSRDIILFFLALDSQAIMLFFLIAFELNYKKATESAWKYFVFNGVASSLILLGMALLFYSTNTIIIEEIGLLMTEPNINSASICGCFLLLFGLCVKIGSFPAHFWLPEIYEGCTPLTLPIVSVIAKVGQFGALFYLVSCFEFVDFVLLFLSLLGLISVLIAPFLILGETDIRRQLGYFSAYSTGIVLLFLGTFPGAWRWVFSFYYLAISSLFLFAYILFWFVYYCSDNSGTFLFKNVYNLAFVFQNNKPLAFFFSFMLVSLLGLPPLSGFFPKFLLLYKLMEPLYLFFNIAFLLSSILLLYVFVMNLKDVFFALMDNRSVHNRLIIVSVANCILLLLVVVLGLYLLKDFSYFMLLELEKTYINR